MCHHNMVFKGSSVALVDDLGARARSELKNKAFEHIHNSQQPFLLKVRQREALLFIHRPMVQMTPTFLIVLHL